MGFRILCLYMSLAFFSSCTNQYERLVNKADREAKVQKSQLAKYIYLQVIQNHKDKDSIRYRALKGLALTSLNQLFDYKTAVKAFEKLFNEFGQEARYESDIQKLRIIAAKVWRINLSRPKRALDVLSPLMSERDFTLKLGQQLGRTYLAMNNYDQARHWFVQSFEKASSKKNCEMLNELQLDLIQVFSLQRKCDDVHTWASMELPEACTKDHFSLAVERAHCLEINGKVERAVSLYEDIIEKNPDNTRAHFFLESMKRRQKEKQTK